MKNLINILLTSETIGSLNVEEQRAIAIALCTNLIRDLDLGIYTKTKADTVGLFIGKMNFDILLCCLQLIGVDRIVKWDLDLNPIWKESLSKLHRYSDDILDSYKVK